MENTKGVQHIVELKNNVEKYYKKAQSVAESFGGPSIYFHEKALECIDKEFLSEKHLEYIYATLASWGMHRMGKMGAKMPDFDIFKNSILAAKKELIIWKELNIKQIGEKEFHKLLPNLTKVCFNITATTSNSRLVSSSKTLAHILPDLVCPMDREYTLMFFYESKSLTKKKECEVFGYVMQKMWDFYHEPKTSIIKCEKSKSFCESYPKIFDNLIIAYKKEKQNKQ